MYAKKLFMLIPLLLSAQLASAITHTIESIDQQHKKLSFTIDLQKNELLYKDAIFISSDSPDVTVEKWRSEPDPLNIYDQVSKQNRLGWAKPTTLSTIITHQSDNSTQAHVHLTYQKNTDSAPKQEIVPVHFDQVTLPEEPSVTPKNIEIQSTQLPIKSSPKKQSWAESLSDLVQKSSSTPVRIILVFFLGLLLSMTPCIYPMIPVTVGVLQSQKGRSVLYNFALSLSYTLGISTTFACFGLLASYTGPVYGKVLSHPIAVIMIVSMLSYLGLSMLGLYELRLPQFMALSNTNRSRKSSLASAFLFGAASGTISSPCVSPGLILLLSIVATLGNVLLGFILLFSFGVGLSVPLLIVGTFSSSLELLPRAGMWMVEVKRLMGVMLLGASLYYLSNILSWFMILGMCGALLTLLGVFYLYQGTRSSKTLKQFHNLFGSSMIACAAVALVFATQERFYSVDQAAVNPITWDADYTHARDMARKEHKLLFIDFWADFCSICKVINNTVLKDTHVAHALDHYVPVSVDGSDQSQEQYKALQEKYNIVGFPTFLVVDPETEKVVAQWSSDLYSIPREQFIGELEKMKTV